MIIIKAYPWPMNPAEREFIFWIRKWKFLSASSNLKHISNPQIVMVSYLWTVVTNQIVVTVRVPGSQFLLMRRNCTDTDTFKSQAMVLRQRFLDKGYDQFDVDLELQNILKVDRGSLLADKPRQSLDESFKWSMLTTYSVQHKQIKSKFTKKQSSLRCPLARPG